MKIVTVKIEAIFKNQVVQIAEDVELDMSAFQEVNNRNLEKAFEDQYPELLRKVPLWKSGHVVYRAGLNIKITHGDAKSDSS